MGGAEKGPWAAVLQRGYDAFQEGDYERALLHYLQAAEMGYELGQSNAAWLLTHVRLTLQDGAEPLSLSRTRC